MMHHRNLVIPHDEFARQEQLSRLLRSVRPETSPTDGRQVKESLQVRTTGGGERKS